MENKYDFEVKIQELQAEISALKQAGVALPDRKVWNQGSGREGKIEADAYNWALDEVARLNASRDVQALESRLHEVATHCATVERERDALAADNLRLHDLLRHEEARFRLELGESERLREAMNALRAMFPAGITKQGFVVNGQAISADGDDEFLSCKKVEVWAAPLLATIDAALSSGKEVD